MNWNEHIATAGELLLSARGYERTLFAILEVFVPALCDSCVLEVRLGEGLDQVSRSHDQPAGSINRVRGGELTVRPAEGLTLPLISDGEVIGSLRLGRGPGGAQEDLAALRRLANLCATALGRAREERRTRDELIAQASLLAIVSHDLRSPLTVLGVSLQLIEASLDGGGADPAQLVARARTARRQVRRLSRITGGLFDFGTLSVRELRLHREPLDLMMLLSEIMSEVEAEATEGGCPISLSGPPALLGTWDKTRVQQVIFNLLSNAVKYGLGRPVEICADGDGESVWFAVRDRGIGIPAEEHARIFERFERAVPERSYLGAGLGLWIVRQLVIAHGGSVIVESAPGQGATFTVRLPRHAFRT